MSDEPGEQPPSTPGFAPPGGGPPSPPPPPAPSPDQPPAPGWWKASDGNWYPPQQHPAGPPPGPPSSSPPGAGAAGDRWVPPPVGHGLGHPGAAPDGSVYYSPGATARPSRGLATWALVLGILSLVLFWACGLGVLFGILAVVFGAMGRSRAREVPGSPNAGRAVAGLVMGLVGIVGGILFIAAVVPDFLDEMERQLDDGICEQDVEFLDPDC